MKFVTCPSLGRRALSEFTYGGRLEKEPDQETVSEKEWTDYVFYQNGAPQTLKEWWYHRPTGIWFLFERNTLTDRITQVEFAKRGVQNEA
ncbi:sarcosine oxidase subunit delta [Thiomicrorhabdus indica]|uniref:sarcosine oxidase subunit delta n=1 Tax=Thiomicrorhabdus indica TaxID=2267253 RepID=UPI00102DD88B|nr:sarcosine oxidase subunit delta [Thiomicrorhabdus indica]